MSIDADPKFEKLMEAFTVLLVEYILRSATYRSERDSRVFDVPAALQTMTVRKLDDSDFPREMLLTPVLFSLRLGVRAFGTRFYDLGGDDAMRAALDDFLDRVKCANINPDLVYETFYKCWKDISPTWAPR